MKTMLSFVVLSFAFAALAHADDRSDMREHYRKGSQAFDLGQFDEAIAEYMKAYRAKEDPALLYNLGQAHRRAGHIAEALHFYKVFLQRSGSGPNRAEVENKIAELQALLEQQKEMQQSPPKDTKQPDDAHAGPARESAPSPRPELTTTPATTNAAVAAATANAGERRAGRAKEIAGNTVAAVGVAAAVMGSVLAGLAKKTSDDLTATARTGGVWNPKAASVGQAEETSGLALVGVGAAAAIAGTVVAVLGIREPRHARRVALAPSLGRNEAALQLRFGF
jgi:tetratricopeptide (TPR) repeat protein